MTSLKPKILRYSRILAAIAITSTLTGVLVSYGMGIPRFAGVLAKIQFLPAAFAFSLTTIVVWLIATMMFGRIYCSTVCPLGVVQDACARIPRLGRFPAKRNYHYSPPLTTWRNISLFVTVVSVLLGVSFITTLLDPYSIFARCCIYVVKPLWGLGWNLFMTPAVKLAAASAAGTAIAIITIGLIGWLASRNGRTFCNSICPVGTSLGFISRYSIFRIDINTDKCIQCRECEHICKASCIDMISHVVDTSRCVVCFDCLTVCPNDAIHYTTNRHQLAIPLMRKVRDPLAGSAAGCSGGHVETHSDKMLLDRRAFLATGLIVAATPVLTAAKKNRKRLEGGLLGSQEALLPTVAVTPPGVHDRKDFLDRCTGCGLCISHCMTKVLRPSVDEYGLLRLLHPVKDYDRAYCAYTCTRCTQLCPTGALSPLTREEKTRSSVGLARVSLDRCTGCGSCKEACPASAIVMEPFANRGGHLYPQIDHRKCIGCGACQFVCPASPYKAIIVNGLQ